MQHQHTTDPDPEPVKDKAFWEGEYQKLLGLKSVIIEQFADRCFGGLTPENEGFCHTYFLKLQISYRECIDEMFPQPASQ